MEKPLVDSLHECVVKLTVPGGGCGTGFFVGPGLILTCAHVVKDIENQGYYQGEIDVRWKHDGKFAKAKVRSWLPGDYDIALLEFSSKNISELPCAYLNTHLKIGDNLYSWGYPDIDFSNGEPLTFKYSGLTGDTPPLIKVKDDRIRPGMSGAPILNLSTRAVCGMLKFTLGENTQIGGGGISATTIFNQISKLKELQEQFGTQDENRKTGNALRTYLDILVQRNRQRSLRDLFPEAGDSSTHTTQMDLERVYVSLNTTSGYAGNAIPDAAKRKENRRPDKEQQPLSAIEAVAGNRCVVVLGDPGSGKTTFLRHMALCLAAIQTDHQKKWQERLQGWPPEELDCIPIHINLKDLAKSSVLSNKSGGPLVLWRYIHSILENQDLSNAARPLKDALEAGKAVVLMDGLDEVSPIEQRRKIQSTIAAFAERYLKSRVIVSCRKLIYEDETTTHWPDFKNFTLAPLDEIMISDFIDKWYSELQRKGRIKTKSETKEKAYQLKDRLKQKDIQPLPQNPLLLTYLAQLDYRNEHLPNSSALIYKNIVDLLLWSWDKRRDSDEKEILGLNKILQKVGCSKSDLKVCLSIMAYKIHSDSVILGKGDLADIDEKVLKERLIKLDPQNNMAWAQEVVTCIKQRSGLLVGSDSGVFTFTHRTLQEYLAGYYLASKMDFAIESAKLFTDNVLWREVILFAIGRLSHLKKDFFKPLALVGEICPEAVQDEDIAWKKCILAADAMVETGVNKIESSILGKDLLNRVRRRLVVLLEKGRLSAAERANAGNSLSQLGDPRFLSNTWFLPDEPLLGFIAIPYQEKYNSQIDASTHSVRPPAFFIARYPVTVAQYQVFIQKTDYPAKQEWKRYSSYLNHPTVWVTWYDAVAYCSWLTNLLKEADLFPKALSDFIINQGWQVRLPTEVEWKKAAQGNDERIYPWGNEPNRYNANYDKTGLNMTAPVGCFPDGKGPFGCLDMAGNTWDWTLNDYTPLDENKRHPNMIEKVVMGGSFIFNEKLTQCAFRGHKGIEEWTGDIGFRIVIAPPKNCC